MKIYVSHSREFNFLEDLYNPLKDSTLAKNNEFIFPHEEGAAFFPVKDLLEKKGCDLVIAEVSYPSTGQGIELAWASAAEVRIVCFYKTGSKLSGSLKTVTSEFIEYNSPEDLILKLSGILE